jgi:hypothetical protein
LSGDANSPRADCGARPPSYRKESLDAGADDTRVERKQFGVLLCLPMAPVLLLIQNGDLGTSPIYGHRRARHRLPLDMHMGRGARNAMGVGKLIADLCQ